MVELTDSQQRAKELVASSRISLLTGGGGTGKTTLLAEWLRESDDMDTIAIAPTGKAAQRLSESFEECGVSCTATTIHAALKPVVGGDKDGKWKFSFNRDSPLPVDRVLVDECSMVDSELMRCLLDAIGENTQVVLIGDDSQLPPVGKGCPFRDMIRSGIFPHAHLTEVHRYAGRIAHVCKSIRDGGKVCPSDRLDLSPDAGEFGPENYRHIERRTPADQLKCLDEIINRVSARGYSPFRDIQVIVTRNTAGGVNRELVNERMQNLLNPKGRTTKDCPFRVGDKVTCRKNGIRDTYGISGGMAQRDGGSAYIPNGDDGIVVHIDEKSVYARFSGGVVRFAKGGWGKEIVLGYAITCHSSQGSGWPVVIYLIDDCILNDRSLVYTGLSRPKKILFTVGKISVINQQIRVSHLRQRKTFLSEMLSGEIAV